MRAPTVFAAALRVAAVIAGCWLATPVVATPAGAPVTQAQPALTQIPLRIVTAARPRRFQVEVAATPREQQVGMMFRTQLPRGRGMLFPVAPPRQLSFWMENTLISLDLVFIGPDARILNVAADAPPRSRDLIHSAGAAAAVLELAAGEAARLGLRPGDRVHYTLPR